MTRRTGCATSKCGYNRLSSSCSDCELRLMTDMTFTLVLCSLATCRCPDGARKTSLSESAPFCASEKTQVCTSFPLIAAVLLTYVQGNLQNEYHPRIVYSQSLNSRETLVARPSWQKTATAFWMLRVQNPRSGCGYEGLLLLKTICLLVSLCLTMISRIGSPCGRVL